MVYQGKLVAYYSDENDYTGFDRRTGVPTLARDNDTGPDAGTQVLVHRTWDGTGPRWSRTVIDVPGTRHVFKDGEYLGGGRPGMPTVSPTTDGKWLMTFEYWGGGAERPLPSWPRPAALPRVRQLRRHLDHEAPGRRRSLTTGRGWQPRDRRAAGRPDGLQRRRQRQRVDERRHQHRQLDGAPNPPPERLQP